MKRILSCSAYHHQQITCVNSWINLLLSFVAFDVLMKIVILTVRGGSLRGNPKGTRRPTLDYGLLAVWNYCMGGTAGLVICRELERGCVNYRGNAVLDLRLLALARSDSHLVVLDYFVAVAGRNYNSSYNIVLFYCNGYFMLYVILLSSTSYMYSISISIRVYSTYTQQYVTRNTWAARQHFIHSEQWTM